MEDKLTAVMVLVPAILAPALQIGLLWASEVPLSRRRAIGLALVSGIVGGCIALLLHVAPVTKLSRELAGAIGTLSGLIPALRWTLIASRVAAEKLNVDLDPHPSPPAVPPVVAPAPVEVPENA